MSLLRGTWAETLFDVLTGGITQTTFAHIYIGGDAKFNTANIINKMIRFLTFAVVSSLVSSSMAAPAPAQSSEQNNQDEFTMLKDAFNLVGKTPEHPFTIPYCGGAPVTISTVNAGVLPKTDENGDLALPDTIAVVLADMEQPVDLTPYDNALGVLIMDMQLPADRPEWAQNLSMTGLLFTSNSSAKFDLSRLSSSNLKDRIIMNMAFSFMTTFDEIDDDDEESVFTVITQPAARIPITDALLAPSEALDISALDLKAKYLTEMGFVVSKGADVDVSEISFSDILLMCLPAPTTEELAEQGMIFWKLLFYHVKGHHFNAVTSLALSKRRMLLGCEPYCLCHGVSGKQAESQDSAIIATQMGPGASCKQDGTCAGGCRMFLRHTIVSLCIQLGIAKHAPTVCDRDYNAARNILYCLLCRAPSSLQARHQYRLGLTTTLNSSRRATHVEGIQNNNARQPIHC
ncbi:hypothetical protein SeLEV6574_g03327 [Synchytrium endobioticum]|uniref:Uncharacterized protein n=1 Tax=Synchytrium endobioticum TaxID=286115 RepID=A0A507D417_9FUNG|nr:hypothetical protein SeLEV6574_g03327 [Synchytrium endobioticum]